MKNILIRDVPKGIVKIVEAYKKKKAIKTNTEAVMRIIKRYAYLEEANGELEQSLDNATAALNEYTTVSQDLLTAQEKRRKSLDNLATLQDYLSGLPDSLDNLNLEE